MERDLVYTQLVGLCAYVFLFVYGNIVYVLSRFMPLRYFPDKNL